MRSLFLICVAVCTCSCDPKSPRVYNVLITSKKNLAPSQALPVYEPVLRTTSVGFVFPPFYYTHLTPIDAPRYVPGLSVPSTQLSEPKNIIVQNSPELDQDRYVPTGPVTQDVSTNPPKTEQNSAGSINPPQTYPEPPSDPRNLPSNVVPLEQFVPIYSHPQLSYQQFYPKEEPEAQPLNFEKVYEEPKQENPKQIVANFKRNPEIPDVPPPPLPVRSTS